MATTAAARIGARASRIVSSTRLGFVRFFVKRVAALVLTCLGISLIAFILTHLIPGNPAISVLGDQAASNPAAVKAFETVYGLNKPLPAQYLIYLGNLIHGNLGVSYLSGQPVTQNLAEFVPASAELAITAMVMALVGGVTLGVVAALRRGTWADHVIRMVSLVGVSVPIFWLAELAVFVFFFLLPILPSSGRLLAGETPPPHVTGLFTLDSLLTGHWTTLWSAIQHLILPASVLALFNMGLVTRFTRAAVLDVVNADYIRAARAKGLPERRIIIRHLVRAALPAILTLSGVAFANALAGTVLVEEVFSWPGMGNYAYQSAINLDLNAIMGVTIFVAVVYVFINFAVDILSAIADPRIELW